MNGVKSIITGFLVGTILLSAILANVAALPMTDPIGDLLDKNGNPTTGEPYLDIIESNLALQGASYVGTIKVNGEVPSKLSDSSIFIEWDFMIDADRNSGTSPWGNAPLLVNDIGVDFMVRLCLIGDRQWAEVFDAVRRQSQIIASQVSGNEIVLTVVPPSGVSAPTDFDFVVLVRKYGNQGAPNALITFDKAPNVGHYAFQAGAVTARTRTAALPTLSMRTDHSTLYYNQGNEEYARYIGDGFDYAYGALQQDFPKVPGQDFKLYVYLTQNDLVQGLISFSGFSKEDAESFTRGGAPRPINYVMHVGPGWDWVGVAHELTHTFIEEYSDGAYNSIKWLDEGLANYESWKCVLNNAEHSHEAERYRENEWIAFNELKNTKGLFPLRQLTTGEQWHELRMAGEQIYPEAFVVVTYLASTYGTSKIIPILRKVQGGTSASEAVRMSLEKTEDEILDAVKHAAESAIFRAISITATLGIGPDQVLNYTISKDLTGPPDYAPVNITYIFSVEDRQVVCQFRIRDIPAGVSFGFRWYSPDGKLYEEYFYPPTSSFSQLTTVDRSMEIRGSSAAKMPGEWRVEGYAGNQLLVTDTFTIQSLSQATTAPGTSPTATATTTGASSESYSLVIPTAVVAVLAISLSYVWSRKRSRSRQTAKQGPGTKN